ncbi:MAG TPA: right-handed parallel beta-helix repeat-containing protein, partial [Elusimicrobiota bacterium]|nr:right-handed parallel beta-helix repeat-containing protein [Elusimicrobiota bacterium]
MTTLEDSGPGSLREALMDPRPRVVVFRVGGTLRLREDLFLRHPFITVAGQTAPGDGILIRDFGLTILTHDVLIQHLRIRPGAERQKNPENNDGLGLLGEAYGGDVHDVVLDHLSVSWAEDENVSVLGGLRDITVSHCLIAEGLNRSRHAKGTHSAGLLIDDTATATVYR